MKKVLLSLLTVVALTVSACSSPEGTFLTADGQPAPDVQRPVYDPPNTFDISNPVQLPDEAERPQRSVTLINTTAYIATSTELIVFDAEHGDVQQRITPQNTPIKSRNLHPPLRTTLHGESVLAVPFFTKTVGHGTQKDSYFLEVLFVGTRDNSVLHSITTDIEITQRSIRKHKYTLLAVHDNSLFISAQSYTARRYFAATYAVSTSDGALLWEDDDFLLLSVTEKTLIGAVKGRFRRINVIEARSLKNATLWNLSEIPRKGSDADSEEEVTTYRSGRVLAARGEYVILRAKYKRPGKYGTRTALIAVSAHTGAVQRTLFDPLSSPSSVNCDFSDDSSFLCWRKSRNRRFIYYDDLSGTTTSWSFRDSDTREVPSVTTLRGSNIYAETKRREAVILRTSDGNDAPDPPGIAPILVNGYLGIAPCPGRNAREWCAYSATS